jgi:hypothetical protein
MQASLHSGVMENSTYRHFQEICIMNLKELLDKLTPEDQNLVLGHFIRSLTGNLEPEDITLRRTATISTLGTQEEIEKEVAIIFNIPLEEIKSQGLAAKYIQLREHHERFQEIISPYKNYLLQKNAKEDKFEELYDLGKLLAGFEDKYKIEIPSTNQIVPDFIIHSQKEKIGVEHTRLISPDTKRLTENVSKILKKAEKLLVLRNPSLKYIINIAVSFSKFNIAGKSILSSKFSVQEKQQLAEKISDYIENILKGQPIDKPAFIENIAISGRTVHPLTIRLSEIYIGKENFTSICLATIAAKEEKYLNYTRNNTIKELWLLIVASGITSSSSFILQAERVKNKFNTSFQKIILFDNFSMESVEIYPTYY